jgi:hypothetical protein
LKTFKIYIKNNIIKAFVILLFTLIISYTNYKIYEQLNIFFYKITEESSLFDISIVIIIIFLYFLIFAANMITDFTKINLLQNGVKNLLIFFITKVFYSEDVYTLNQNYRELLIKATKSCNSISKYYTSIINIISTTILLTVYGGIIYKISSSVCICQVTRNHISI